MPWGHQSILGVALPVDPTLARADNPAWMNPAGGLHLSPADLVWWGQAHLAACRGDLPSFLAKQSCVAMQTPVADAYGLGWVVQPLDDFEATIVWHNGSNTMWYAVLAIVPEHELAIAVAHNRDDFAPIDALLRDLIEVLLNSRR